ncbi:unnamed protein product [Lepeophtheirus salmonis]|uniref:(salmon louse) hypothetical protein n=1 Tax=Lepeophtheirus salmonis TaxID=72036 RepID=A0A7R8CB08_LEPSM|nr:unnamed protein product [Lepeophtheirus salmonis]CAF2756340.1 unnamed protein product [Lepeophtheirus salmonis]
MRLVLLSLEEINLSNNLIGPTLSKEYLKFHQNNITINLRDNQIKEMEPFPLHENQNINIYLSGNPIDCNCKSLEFHQWTKRSFSERTVHIPDIDRLMCASPLNLKDRVFLDVPSNQLTCPFPSVHIPNVFCPCMQCQYIPFTKTIHLNCSNSELTQFPERVPSPIKETLWISLDMSNNHLIGTLQTLESLFYVQNLTELYLSHNQITSISHQLPANMRLLHLDNNRLEITNEEVSALINAPELVENLFTDCLKTNDNPNLEIIDASQVVLRDCNIQGKEKDILISQFADEEEFCLELNSLVIIYVLPAILVLYPVFRQYFIRNDESKNPYDVFISYSHEDSDYVEGKLVDGLESPQDDPLLKYKCLLAIRDFVPGEVISEQIKSHFAQNWDLPSKEDIGPSIMNYISQNTYLDHDHPNFWRNIRYALPHKGNSKSWRPTWLKPRKMVNQLHLMETPNSTPVPPFNDKIENTYRNTDNLKHNTGFMDIGVFETANVSKCITIMMTRSICALVQTLKSELSKIIGTFSLICESFYSIDNEEEEDFKNSDHARKTIQLTEHVKKFQLNLGEIHTLEIVDCPNPTSYSHFFNILKITKLDVLAIESTILNPVVLSPSILPKCYLMENLKSLILRNPGFTFNSPDAFIHLRNLINFEGFSINLPQFPNFRNLQNLNTLKLHQVPFLKVERKSLVGLRNLTLLSLTSDNLIHLPNGLLRPLSNLVTCKFSNNLINNIPSNFFAHNLALKEVIWYRDYNIDCHNESLPCVRKFPKNMFGACSSLTSFYYSSSSSKMKVIFHKDIFSRCSELRTLHITEAGMTSRDLLNFNISQMKNLTRLVLYKNNITSLTNELMLSRDVDIHLENNPLNCSDCETLGTYLALKNINRAICFNSHDIANLSTPHDAWIYNNCSQVGSSGLHIIHIPSHLYIFIGVGFALILILLILISLILTNQCIRIRLYNIQFWSVFFQNEIDENIQYDAFISYAEEDWEYVRQVILPGLEEGQRNGKVIKLQRTYKCCDHYRDWMVESSWAQIEFDEAYIKRKVIMVLRGSESQLSDRLELFPSINHYVETFTYLKEDDPLFWEKLTYLLLIEKCKRRRV